MIISVIIMIDGEFFRTLTAAGETIRIVILVYGA
jgi:hypothetical protein